MPPEHKHAEILRAIADGREVEFNSDVGKGWCAVTSSSINPLSYLNFEFRIKPQEITTKWGSIPKPFHPAVNGLYWTFDSSGNIVEYSYVLDCLDTANVHIGFMWETEADAAQAKEVISAMMHS